MGTKLYITDEERKKCRKVVEAFKELYERTDVIALDAGKYGFVKLQYYKLPAGFDAVATYRNSESLFNDLWDEWLCDQLLTLVQGTPTENLDYKEIFMCLPEEKQKELMAKKRYFEERSRDTPIYERVSIR